MSWMDIGPGQLWEEPVSMRDMETSLHNSKPSVEESDLVKLKEFTSSFGLEGGVA